MGAQSSSRNEYGLSSNSDIPIEDAYRIDARGSYIIPRGVETHVHRGCWCGLYGWYYRSLPHGLLTTTYKEDSTTTISPRSLPPATRRS